MAGAQLLAQGTQRRVAILRFIRAYRADNGFSPSLQEIADGADGGPISRTAVRHHIHVLLDRGVLANRKGAYRTLTITGRHLDG